MKLPAPSTRTSILEISAPSRSRLRSDLAGSAALAALQEVIDQLGTGVTHFHFERFDSAGEIVVRPHRGHSYEKTKSAGSESIGKTAGHGAQTARLLRLSAWERVDDASDGAE